MAWSASNAILIVSALCVLTPLVTYLIAVQKGHVDPLLPHIATTGDRPPESTVFTQLVVVTTAFALLVVHVRFVYVSFCCEAHAVDGCHPRLNTLALCIGYGMCAGLLVLGCFQESNAFYIHNVASVVFFSAGCLFYITIQTVISYGIVRYTRRKTALYLRVTLNFLIFICMSTYLVGLVFCRMRCSTAEGLKICKNGPHWKYHLIGAVSEWLLTVFYAAYLSTFYGEFRSVKLSTTRIRVAFREDDASPAVGT